MERSRNANVPLNHNRETDEARPNAPEFSWNEAAGPPRGRGGKVRPTRRRGVGATALVQHLKRARQLVELLNRHVLSAFEGDQARLAEWRVARRVRL